MCKYGVRLIVQTGFCGKAAVSGAVCLREHEYPLTIKRAWIRTYFLTCLLEDMEFIFRKGPCFLFFGFLSLILFQLYVELLGPEQPESVPDIIYLQIRHLSESFFRKGDENFTEFRQPLGNNRTISYK